MTHATRGEGPYRGRFAPSPTGWLHLGNARTALLAWLRARASGGEFVLRVEDLDAPRSRPEAVAGNLVELAWLGLDWDEGPDVGGPHAPYRQSERDDRYQAALARLTELGLTFPCYLSRKDLAEAASAPHDSEPGGEPVYGAAERALSQQVAAEKVAAGRSPSLRFAAPPHTVAFDDLFAGPQRFDVERDVGHFVVRRADGLWAYQLAVVLDDAAMRIGEVVRGADLLRSTAAQLLIYRALDLTAPHFAHLPLLLDEHGERLAKRRGSLTLRGLEAAGVRPERVVGLLAWSLGLLERRKEVEARELVAGFDLARTDYPPARLTDADLSWLTSGGAAAEA